MPSDSDSRSGDNAEDTSQPEASNQLPAPARETQPSASQQNAQASSGTSQGMTSQGVPSQAVPSQADDDGHLIELWLHGKSPNTQEAYRRDLFQFIDFADLPLRHVRLGDLQDWADHLEAQGLAPATRSRKLGTVKSLFSFGHRIGYLIYNVGAAISGPKVPNRLAERILADVIAKLLEQLFVDSGLEPAGVPCSAGHVDRFALARLLGGNIAGDRGCCHRQRDRGAESKPR